MLEEGVGKGDASRRNVFLRLSFFLSLRFSCVWVSLVTLPDRHLSQLPWEPLETPEFRVPPRTVTKEFESRTIACESWGLLW